jgi:DNA-binding HxlR family transcriptional regulator
MGTDVISAFDCIDRLLLDQIADKWSVLIVASLFDGPLGGDAIKRRIDGITQRGLTRYLRRLERNGIIERRVVAISPILVDFKLTALGHSLDQTIKALCVWTREHLHEVESARACYDGRAVLGQWPLAFE